MEQTQKSNELTQESVKAAIAPARVAQQQFDSQLLDKYLPIQTAIGSAIGNIRASRALKETMKFQMVPAEFAPAIQAAALVGGSLHATLQIVNVSLETAQKHRDNLLQSLQSMAPTDPFIQGLRELVELHRRGAEVILECRRSRDQRNCR